MPFPISFSGTVHVRGVGVEKAAHGIERALAEARAPAARTRNRIVFRRGAWKYGLKPIEYVTEGLAEVTGADEGVAVTFRVTLTHQVWIGSGFVALVGVPFVVHLGVWAPPVLLFLWLWLVGVPYLGAALEWPSFLAGAAAARPGTAVLRKRASSDRES